MASLSPPMFAQRSFSPAASNRWRDEVRDVDLDLADQGRPPGECRADRLAEPGFPSADPVGDIFVVDGSTMTARVPHNGTAGKIGRRSSAITARIAELTKRYHVLAERSDSSAESWRELEQELEQTIVEGQVYVIHLERQLRRRKPKADSSNDRRVQKMLTELRKLSAMQKSAATRNGQ